MDAIMVTDREDTAAMIQFYFKTSEANHEHD